MNKLLSRDAFRNATLQRDKYRCVICGTTTNLNVHHIVERRLFNDGGYYLDNAVTLCESHHLDAEQTTLSCDTLRETAGIRRVVLPDHLLPDSRYDKWGNPILENGCRLKGELFFKEPVQKVLQQANMLNLFEERVKYPRTRHFSWSRQKDNDDVVLWDTGHLEGQEVLVSEKMDGEGTTMYRGMIHARSLEPMIGEDRARVKQLHASLQWEIPDGWRICGENVSAKHSIHYTHLESFFYVYSIWNEQNECLSWDDTVVWCDLLDLTPVREIYCGVFAPSTIHDAFLRYREAIPDEAEGYVCRPTRAFHFSEFGKCCAKWVRQGHVKTTKFWRFEERVWNELAPEHREKGAPDEPL